MIRRRIARIFRGAFARTDFVRMIRINDAVIGLESRVSVQPNATTLTATEQRAKRASALPAASRIAIATTLESRASVQPNATTLTVTGCLAKPTIASPAVSRTAAATTQECRAIARCRALISNVERTVKQASVLVCEATRPSVAFGMSTRVIVQRNATTCRRARCANRTTSWEAAVACAFGTDRHASSIQRAPTSQMKLFAPTYWLAVRDWPKAAFDARGTAAATNASATRA